MIQCGNERSPRPSSSDETHNALGVCGSRRRDRWRPRQSYLACRAADEVAPADLDEVERVGWIAVAAAWMIGVVVGWPKQLPRMRRLIGVLATVAAGVTLGSVVRLAAMPADPTGQMTSPICGGLLGLVFALFVLVVRDNDPWRKRGP